MSRLWAVAVVCAAVACGSNNPGSNGTSGESGTCDKDKDCDGATVCCSGQCENLALSNDACGACGVQCTADQYCTGTACADLTFSSLCGNGDFLVVHRDQKSIQGVTDNPQIDNDASDSLAASLHTLCGGSSPTATVTAETDVLASSSNGPLITGRGTTVIVAGGRIYSSVIDYLDEANVTPVELVAQTDYFQLVSRAERKVIVQDSLGHLGDNLDYIIGQAIYDATSGTQVLNVYGIMQTGTVTGADYFASLIAQAGFGTNLWFVAKVQNGEVTRLDGQ